MPTVSSLNGSAPKYLSDLSELYRPALRSSNSLDLVVSRLKAYGDWFFKKMAPFVWNCLPLSIRRSKSLSEFRSALKTPFYVNGTMQMFYYFYYCLGSRVCKTQLTFDQVNEQIRFVEIVAEPEVKATDGDAGCIAAAWGSFRLGRPGR